MSQLTHIDRMIDRKKSIELQIQQSVINNELNTDEFGNEKLQGLFDQLDDINNLLNLRNE